MLLRDDENFRRPVAFRSSKSFINGTRGSAARACARVHVQSAAKRIITRAARRCGNQREFVAGNAAIIFREFFPILRIANRFRVYPPSIGSDRSETAAGRSLSVRPSMPHSAIFGSVDRRARPLRALPYTRAETRGGIRERHYISR